MLVIIHFRRDIVLHQVTVKKQQRRRLRKRHLGPVYMEVGDSR